MLREPAKCMAGHLLCLFGLYVVVNSDLGTHSSFHRRRSPVVCILIKCKAGSVSLECTPKESGRKGMQEGTWFTGGLAPGTLVRQQYYRGWCDTSWFVQRLGALFQSNEDHEDPDMWLEATSRSFQASLSRGGRAGRRRHPKNNSYLTHFAPNLTGLPARWGSAWPIFLSIFSRDLMRAISLLR